MKDRKKLGQGYDHQVYNAILQSDWIYKIPHGLNFLLTRIRKEERIAQLQAELTYFKNLSETTGILIPTTRIMSTGTSYVIVQRLIENDPGADVQSRLDQLDPQHLKLYDQKAANFRIQGNKLYSLDPFNSLPSRLCTDWGLFPYTKYRRLVEIYRTLPMGKRS